MLSHFPTLPITPSTQICRHRLAPRAQRIEKEKSKVLREIRKKANGCCLKKTNRRGLGRKEVEIEI